MFGLNKKQRKPDYELVKWIDGQFSVRHDNRYYDRYDANTFTQPEYVLKYCMMPEEEARKMYNLLCDAGEVVSSCIVQ